jgi:hypothetical protein
MPGVIREYLSVNTMDYDDDNSYEDPYDSYRPAVEVL